MSKGPSMVARGARRAAYTLIVGIMAIGGLALAAGGGYLLLADDSITDLPTSMKQVLAEEVTPGATPRLTAIAPTGAPSLAIGTPTEPAPTPTDVPEVTVTADSEQLLEAAATTPTPTRIVRATSVPTQTPTPVPGTTELPDTGFGEFVQPIAGLGLAGIAIVTHAIRRRR
jgi:hypothetical protein